MKFFAFLIAVAVVLIPLSVLGSTLYDYYNTGNDNWQSTYSSDWYAQTFTATTTYTVSSVRLLVDKDGTPITPATVSIRATAGDPALPTGSDLCSGTLDPTTFQTGVNWEEFTMSAGCELTQSTIYAIIARCINCTGSGNDFNWNMDYANGAYAGGKAAYSSNSGASWSVYDDGNTDMLFEVWGNVATSSTSTVVAGQFEFPMLLIVMLAVFLICLIIASVSAKIVKTIDKAYKYKL